MSVTIRLEHCARTFDNGTRALEPTDLVINGGETLVFLGPSGCGKTTTLRLVAGLDVQKRFSAQAATCGFFSLPPCSR